MLEKEEFTKPFSSLFSSPFSPFLHLWVKNMSGQELEQLLEHMDSVLERKERDPLTQLKLLRHQALHIKESAPQPQPPVARQPMMVQHHRFKKSLRDRVLEVDPTATESNIRVIRCMVINGHKQIPEVLRKCFKITKQRKGLPMAYTATAKMCELFFPEATVLTEKDLMIYVTLSKENLI